jgi:hypothetical protein
MNEAQKMAKTLASGRVEVTISKTRGSFWQRYFNPLYHETDFPLEHYEWCVEEQKKIRDLLRAIDSATDSC